MAEEIHAMMLATDARFCELERDVLALVKAMTAGSVCAEAMFERVRRHWATNG